MNNQGVVEVKNSCIFEKSYCQTDLNNMGPRTEYYHLDVESLKSCM